MATGGPRGSLDGGKRSKLQLLVHLAQNKLTAGGVRLNEDQLDTLSLALSSVPLSELCLDKSECITELGRPRFIGHHMAKATDASFAAAVEQQRIQGRHAPTVSWTRPPITYLHIYEDSIMSLGVFCMPALSQIPLHDHPGMTVFTRVLYGQMHYMAYDWVDPACRADYDQPEPARLVTDRTLRSQDDPIVLFPRAGGNLHQLTALTDCAIISLLCPPYSSNQGRDCHYYQVFETRDEELEADVHLLEECEPPAEFYIGCGKYRGVVPSGRPRAPSPTTTLEIPLMDSRGSSQALSPVFMSPNSSGGLTAGVPMAAPVAGCSMAAAVAAVERAVLAAPVPQHVHPRPDTIPIPQRWLSG